MGTDIHSIIEFKDEDCWQGIVDGEWYLLRDYSFFCAIAGIRCHKVVNPISPKGLPEIYSYELLKLIAYEVIDDEKYLSVETVLRSQAETWVATGKSKYCGSTGSEKNYVLDPDYHTYSWLTLPELKSCVDSYSQVNEVIPLDIKILLDVLQVLVNHNGMDNVRFVFWFDN